MLEYYYHDLTIYSLTSLVAWKLIQHTSLHWSLSIIVAFPIALLIIISIVASIEILNHLWDSNANANMFIKAMFVILYVLVLPIPFLLYLLGPVLLVGYQVAAIFHYGFDWIWDMALVISLPLTGGFVMIWPHVLGRIKMITGGYPPLISYALRFREFV